MAELAAKKITNQTQPENATIYIAGAKVGNGTKSSNTMFHGLSPYESMQSFHKEEISCHKSNPVLCDSIVTNYYNPYFADGPFNNYDEKVIFEYDHNGNIILETRYGRTVTESSHDNWMALSKNEYAYDESGNILMTAYYPQYNYEAEHWKGEIKYDFNYDENQRLISTIRYDWSILKNNWVEFQKDEVLYDNHDNMTKFIFYIWSEENNEWQLNPTQSNRIFENVYDGNGNLLEHIAYEWSFDINQWKESYKEVYKYDSNSNKIGYIYAIWRNKWIETSKTEYTYNSDRDLILEIIDDIYRGQFKHEYIYDNAHNRVLDLYSQWGFMGDEYRWRIVGKVEYCYDDYKNQTLLQSYAFSETKNEFIKSYKEEQAFDLKGNRILFATYSGLETTDDWVGNYKEILEYDEYNNKTFYGEYRGAYDTCDWIAEIEDNYQYIYNDLGNIASCKTLCFDVLDNIKMYYYNSNTGGIKELDNDCLDFKIENRNIVFKQPENVTVTNLQGHEIFRGITDRIAIPENGIYIVSNKSISIKLFIK